MLTAAIIQWLHLTAAAVWAGSQLFLILVAGPALRVIEDSETSLRVLRVLVGRYNVVGWVSLLVLVLTGLQRTYSMLPTLGPLSGTFYGGVLFIKIGMVAAILLLTLVHSTIIGPRLLALMSTSTAASDPSYRRLRRISLAVSSATLLLSLGVLAAVALLRTGPF